VLKSSFQILAFLAILNPFCCCIAAGVFAGDSDVGESYHGCCASSPSDDSNSGNSKDSHDPENCQHRALTKYYDLANDENTTVSHFSCLLPPVSFIGPELKICDPATKPTRSIAFKSSIEPSPFSFSQVYCVYRI
jgi:hypothetical protein